MAKKTKTETTEGAAPEAAEAAAAPKAPKLELRTHNGITEPRPGSKTRRVWDIANEVGAATGAPPQLAAVKERAQAEGLNDATIQTQYNRFRKFYGLPPQGRPAKPAAEAAPASEPTPEPEPAQA